MQHHHHQKVTNPFYVPGVSRIIHEYESFCDFEPRDRKEREIAMQMKRLLIKRLWDVIESDKVAQSEAKRHPEGFDAIRGDIINGFSNLTRDQAEKITEIALTKGDICNLLHRKGGWI